MWVNYLYACPVLSIEDLCMLCITLAGIGRGFELGDNGQEPWWALCFQHVSFGELATLLGAIGEGWRVKGAYPHRINEIQTLTCTKVQYS